MKKFLFAAMLAALHSCNAQPVQPAKKSAHCGCDPKQSDYCYVWSGSAKDVSLCELNGDCNLTYHRYDRIAKYALRVQHVGMNGAYDRPRYWVSVSEEQYRAALATERGSFIKLEIYVIEY